MADPMADPAADPAPERGALAHLGAAPAIEAEGIRLGEAPRTGKIILRGEGEAFGHAVRQALDIDLPLAANTSSETAPLSALWLGPDEWLLLCAAGSTGSVMETLRQTLAGQHAAIVDIGDSRTVLRLSGAAAREVLARGCSLDLHRREFALGDVAQTRLAMAEVILHQCGEDEFDIYVARSFTDYLWRWLADAIAVG